MGSIQQAGIGGVIAKKLNRAKREWAVWNHGPSPVTVLI
jgi:hypothetical protein